MPSKMPTKASSTPNKQNKNEEEFTAQSQAAADVAVEQEDNKTSSSQPILKSKKFGGDGGTEFNHGTHKAIAKITVKCDRHAIHQINVVYIGGKLLKSGKDDGDATEFKFMGGEYVTGIKVRHNKLIQSLTFITNTGEIMGPVGGKGWKLGTNLLGKDKEGDEEEINAPSGYKLGGLSGSAGDYIDSVVFHWVPIS